MTELRQRMIADMTSAGLAPSTKAVYLRGVRSLAAFYRRSPDQLSEAEVRSYLLHLRDQRGVARGTYTPHHGGIRFFFAHTLDREWSLFPKKSPSAQAQTFTQCAIGRGSSRNPRPCKEAGPENGLSAHVCMRPAHQRGCDTRSDRSRWHQRVGPRRWQGQQGTSSAAAAAGPRRVAPPVEDASQPAMAVPQPEPQRANQPRRVVVHVSGSGPRSRHHETPHAAFAAAWLCHAAPGKRRRHQGRADSARNGDILPANNRLKHASPTDFILASARPYASGGGSSEAAPRLLSCTNLTAPLRAFQCG